MAFIPEDLDCPRQYSRFLINIWRVQASSFLYARFEAFQLASAVGSKGYRGATFLGKATDFDGRATLSRWNRVLFIAEKERPGL